MATIREISAGPTSLDVTWDDGTVTSYPWIWLRDHAHDPETLHPVTQQRLLFTAGLPRDLVAKASEVAADDLVVDWLDGTSSTIPLAFLARFREQRDITAWADVERVLWDASMINPAPSTPYEEVMGSQEGMVRWLRQIAEHGFAIVSGTPATGAATRELIERVAYIRESIFGGFWEFTADLKHADTAYTNNELLGHTDGTYSHDAPGLQLLHCLEFDGEGGESTIVDAWRIAAEMRAHHPEAYEFFSDFEVPGQYVGDGVHLMSKHTVFRHNRAGELVQVSFNNPDRAPFLLSPADMERFYDALWAFEGLANDPAMQWIHTLRPGEAMMFDNWRVLHGRKSYTGKRRLCGAYLNHEDFESRLRLAR
jgi:trimethyllysine dioxygenase